jgi:multiple sugar transport system substrate-binding protein
MARSLTRRLGVALILLLVASCAGSTDPGGEGEQQAEISFLTFGDPAELKAFRDVITGFEQTQDDVRVQLIEASDRTDLLARLSTSLAGGSPPDVFLLNYRYYAQFAAKDAIEPVGDRLAESDVIAKDDFYPVALDAFRWRDELMCVPQNISSLVVYYNRDLFEQYNVPEPQPGWTWNDMVSTAGLLTRDASGARVPPGETEGTSRVAVYGLGVEPSMIRVAPFVWSNGGELVDDEDDPSRFTFDTPEAREALRNFLELRLAYGVIPTDEEVEAEDDETRFANGRLAMLLSSRRATPTLRDVATFDWDVAALPQYEQPSGILHSDAYCITSASKNKAASWRFVEYANSPEGQRIVALTGRTVPSLISVSESAAFLDTTQPPRNSRVFIETVPSIRRVPTTSTWPEIEDATSGILENAMYLATPVDEVIRQLDEATTPLFARGQSP